MRLTKSIFTQILIVILTFTIISFLLAYVKVYYTLFTIHRGFTPEVDKVFHYVVTDIGYTFAILTILIISFTWFVLKRKLAPLKNIIWESKRLTSQKDFSPIKVTTNDELALLAKNINFTKDRLQYSMLKLKNSYERERKYREDAERINNDKTLFLQAVSENLITPLKPIINQSNIIISNLNNNIEDQNLNRKIRVIREHANNMLSTLSNLDEVTALESQAIQPNITSVNLYELYDSLLNLYSNSAQGKLIKLATNYTSDISKNIETDKEILFHILGNIISYLIHNSAKETKITVSNILDGDSIIIQVSGNAFSNQMKSLVELFEHNESNTFISTMAIHLSNSKLFGITSAIYNAEVINGELSLETSDSSVTFNLKIY